jgi:hypothetical protein
MRIVHKHRQRRGNVLILFALMTFVIFAVAALTIDLGLVRVAHRQMQGATDAAAVEGLRYRDEIPPWLLDPKGPLFTLLQQDGIDLSDPTKKNDPALCDEVRRWMARNQINLNFANYADPVTGYWVQYGAGPMYHLSGGTGAANAWQLLGMPQPTPTSQTIAPANTTVYQPGVQLNLNNVVSGDLVSGNFTAAPNSPTLEQADYSRSDFSPVPAGSTPPADAFLARLRRTQDTQGRDRNPIDNVSGVSTTGPAMPLLFGQATLIAGGDPNAGYSPRHHGITVRGTAIAQARPVLAAGQAITTDTATGTPGLLGVATFAIKLSDWQSLTSFSASTVTFYQKISPARDMVMIGDTLIPIAGTLPPATANQVYVPLVDGSNMVAAFGYVSASPDGSVLTKQPQRIASENASASAAVFRLNPADPSVPDPGNAAVLALLTTLMNNPPGNPSQYLLAPALAR